MGCFVPVFKFFHPKYCCMKRFIFKHAASSFTALALCMTLFCSAAVAGVDSYQIYLNNKLLMKQFVTQPLTLESLQLNHVGSKDVLVIYYSHCGAIGKGRVISIKDEHGVVLKEWKFADATGSNTGMVIPAMEITALQKKGAHLSLCYASQQLPEGRMLTSIAAAEKSQHACNRPKQPGRATGQKPLAA